MGHFLGIDWRMMMFPGIGWLEKMIRPAIVYLLLLLYFRLASRRELVQATLFDLLVLLLISNVVQNAMIGPDDSILGGAVGALVLIGLTLALDRITAYSRRAERLLEGAPVLLVHHGKMQEEIMRRQAVSQSDLFHAIRKQGIARLADVEFAILELDGTISVIPRDNDERPHDCLPGELVGFGEAASA